MKKISWFFALTAVCFGCILSVYGMSKHTSAAGAQYISEIVTGADDEGRDDLTKRGYSIMSPSLIDKSGQSIWVGYKTTEIKSNAATDIRIKSTQGNIELETLKERGKSPVTDIRILSADTNNVKTFDEVYPLPNNGAVPVKDVDGNAAEFNTMNGKCYLTLIKADIWKNYIGGVITAKAGSKKAAINELAKAGCEYYVDKNLSSKESSYVYTGYTRTVGEDDAVTDIMAFSRKDLELDGYELVGNDKINNKYLYISHDKKYGNPITGLEYFSAFEAMDISPKQWIDMVTAKGDNSATKPYIIESDDYIKMIESSDDYIIKRIDSDDNTDTGLVIITLKNDLDTKTDDKNKMIAEVVSEAGPEPEEEPETGEPETEQQDLEDVGEDVSDGGEYAMENDESNSEDMLPEETPEVTPQETEDVTATEEAAIEDTTEDTDAVGTAIENGNRMPGVVEIIIFIVLAAAIPVVTFIIKKKYGSK